MDKTGAFSDFFENPFAKKYLESSDHIIRRSVTGISASCELLRRSAEKNGDRNSCELIDCIMNMCCDLMRNAELSRALAAGKPAGADLTTVRADLFLRSFSESCGKRSDGKCSVEVLSAPDTFIRTDKEALSFLLLGFIRRSIIGSNGGNTHFELECTPELKTLNIEVRSLRTFVDGGLLVQPDVFTAFFNEVCCGLAERIGASVTVSDDSIAVVIPLAGSSGTAIVEAPAVETETGFFDPFGLMLSDI